MCVTSQILITILGSVIGAFLAGCIAVYINYRNMVNTAKENLRENLLAMRDYFGIEITDNQGNPKRDFFQEFRESYPRIMSLYICYCNLLRGDKRTSIKKAWTRYKGSDGDSPVDTNTEQAFNARIDALLEKLK